MAAQFTSTNISFFAQALRVDGVRHEFFPRAGLAVDQTRPLVGAMSAICWRSAFIGTLSPSITLRGASCFLSSRFSCLSLPGIDRRA